MLGLILFLSLGLSVSAEGPIYGTKATIEGTSFCKKFSCKLVSRGKLDLIGGTTADYTVVYPIDPYSRRRDGQETIIGILWDKNGRIIGFQIQFKERFLDNGLGFYDVQLAIDLVALMIGKQYRNAPNMGDDFNSGCFGYLSRKTDLHVMAKGSITPAGSSKPKPYVLYCAIVPSSKYPYRRVQEIPDEMLAPDRGALEVVPYLELYEKVNY
ncbi:hypothetical protein [Calidithermus chliarophilus]|uniref:hypothetical protein n=1 Tax=Calidithermus chliarophilus TaxID=52023 RepID=UPI00146F9E21|nr:hypothetical protein [Calidithermus chliarophilus]